jgi:hypothetical protein
VRVLADPFRLKLLGAFGDRPRTTKQVAQRLGEKPTKLYHHVEALERVGLLVLKETRPNRGTLEKYYQAVATRFRIGGALFSTGETPDPMADETAAMLMSILDTTRAELAETLSRTAGGAKSGSATAAMVARMLLRGEPARIERFRSRLTALLEQFKAESAGVERDKTAPYALTLAFYPLSPDAKCGEGNKPAPGQTAAGGHRPAKRRDSPPRDVSASVERRPGNGFSVTPPRTGQSHSDAGKTRRRKT